MIPDDYQESWEYQKLLITIKNFELKRLYLCGVFISLPTSVTRQYLAVTSLTGVSLG